MNELSSSSHFPHFPRPLASRARSQSLDQNDLAGARALSPTDLFAQLQARTKGARQTSEPALATVTAETAVKVPAQPATLSKEKKQIRARLDAIAFADGIDRQEQVELEEAYIAWATTLLEQRQQAFGPGNYQLASDMQPAGTRALLPMAYHFSTSFLRSAMRSPVGMATRQWLSTDNESIPQFVPTITGGTVAGASIFVVTNFINAALERRAQQANLPSFKPIDPSLLAPSPGPVHLEIDGEGKKYYCKNELSAATPPASVLSQLERDEQAHTLREKIRHQQSLLGEKHWINVLAKPSYDSAFAMIRRLISTPSMHEGARFLGMAMLTNGLSGGLYKSTIELSKAFSASGQIDIPDLIGGKQRVNLFQLTPPNPDLPTPQWSDIKQLPRYFWHSAQESGALVAQSVKTPINVFQSTSQLLIHHIFGNTLSALTSKSACKYIASYLNNQNHTPTQRVFNAYAETASQSFVSDCVWNLWKNQMGHHASIGQQLDRQRQTKQVKLLHRASQMITHATELLATFRGDMQAQKDLRLEQGLPDRFDGHSALAARIDYLLEQLNQWQKKGLGTVTRTDQACLSQEMIDITHLASTLNATNSTSPFAPVQHLITQACKDLQQRHALLEWSPIEPAPATSARF